MRVAAVVVLSLFAGAAVAKDVGGVDVKDSATVGGAALVLNGAGVREKFFVKVYVASLYLPKKQTTVDGVLGAAPRRVQLNILRGLEAKTLVEAMNEGLKANNTAAALAAVKAEHDKLVATMNALGALKQGDVITFDFANDETTLALNGKAKGTFASAAFNAAILKVWVGAKPVQDDLKQHLLGS